MITAKYGKHWNPPPPAKKQGASIHMSTANATRVDTLNHRDHLMRFLEELDGELSVAKVRDALEEYK